MLGVLSSYTNSRGDGDMSLFIAQGQQRLYELQALLRKVQVGRRGHRSRGKVPLHTNVLYICGFVKTREALGT